MSVEIAIIGGTGVYDPAILEGVKDEVVATDYGNVPVKIGSYKGREVAFMARHGAGHSIPPHRINYRANMKALARLGVKSILATSAVGSVNRLMKPGDFVLLDQFIDFTKGRTYTFFEGGPEGVTHVDYTEPYCEELRGYVIQAAQEIGQEVHPRGVYVCTEGPRFETPAEIRMFDRLGGDLVGMTQVPEVVLAREVEICYAAIAMVTNFAAGISPTPLTHGEVVEIMAKNGERLKKLLMRAIELIPPGRRCGRGCHAAVHR